MMAGGVWKELCRLGKARTNALAEKQQKRSRPRKIITNNIFPPIPIRTFDWCAYYDGDEELHRYGYGRTEEEAIADFKSNYLDEQGDYL